MSNYKELKAFFKSYNVCPYEILGISKNSDKKELKRAYRAKALLLHPDKNTFDTTLEFQILGMAYEYIRERIKKYTASSHQELKMSYEQDLNETDNLQKEEIVRSAAPKSGYGNFARSTETDYTKISIDKPEQLMKKFNSDKFNAIFEHLKSLTDESTVIKHELNPYSQRQLASCKVITDGDLMLVGEDDTLDDYTNQHGVDYLKGFSTISQPSKKKLPKDIDYSRSSVKAHMKSMKQSEIKSQINQKFKPITPKFEKNFAEMQADFINNQMEGMRLEHQRNKTFIQKNPHLFPDKSIAWDKS